MPIFTFEIVRCIYYIVVNCKAKRRFIRQKTKVNSHLNQLYWGDNVFVHIISQHKIRRQLIHLNLYLKSLDKKK